MPAQKAREWFPEEFSLVRIAEDDFSHKFLGSWGARSAWQGCQLFLKRRGNTLRTLPFQCICGGPMSDGHARIRVVLGGVALFRCAWCTGRADEWEALFDALTRRREVSVEEAAASHERLQGGLTKTIVRRPDFDPERVVIPTVASERDQ
jgi:hypothetical protein